MKTLAILLISFGGILLAFGNDFGIWLLLSGAVVFNLPKPKHIHRFSKPLMGKYVGFSTRDVIWECKCGERKLFRESKAFSSPFSAPTTMLDHRMFNEVLNRQESETTLMYLKISKDARGNMQI